MERLIILFVFAFNYSHADTLDEEVRKQTNSLKSRGIEKVFVHQHSLFNGRYNTPYDVPELRCDNVPTVVHIFWLEGGKWKCLRLDKCGLFEIVSLDRVDFDKLIMDAEIEFKKESPHFTTYRLTKLYEENRESVLVSGTQLTNERNGTTKTFKKINRVIRRLEDSHKFKRVQ